VNKAVVVDISDNPPGRSKSLDSDVYSDLTLHPTLQGM